MTREPLRETGLGLRILASYGPAEFVFVQSEFSADCAQTLVENDDIVVKHLNVCVTNV